MTTRMILTAIIALCACSLAGAAGAIEIELTYTKAEADSLPSNFFMVNSGFGDAGGWENGEGILTDRAVVFVTDGRLGTVDYGTEDGEHPDVLYVDIDGDRAIGAGERFALAPHSLSEGLPPDLSASTLIAAKIPLCAESTDGPGTDYLNYIFIKNEQFCLVATSAWGYFTGECSMDGIDYEVRLVDQNANGSFLDFAGDTDQDCDHLILIDKKTQSQDMQLLRRKILFNSGACAVDVRDKGGRLVLEPVEMPYGTVAVPEGMTLDLYNSEWGARSVAAGGDTRLPAGAYWVRSFSRQQNEPFAFCSYRGSQDLKVTIEPGAVAKIELETLLHGKVTAKKQGFGKTMRLSLEMATSQGATFQGYSKQDSRGRSALQGIPFFITDKDGNIVVDDMFKFG